MVDDRAWARAGAMVSASLVIFACSTYAHLAAAQTPPPDLPPPVAQPPSAPSAPPAAPPSAAPPSAAPPPAAPQPVAPPPPYTAPWVPWPSPNELPPGYARPAYPYPSPTNEVVPPLPPRRRYDTGLFAGGIVAVFGGMSAVVVGAYLVSSAASRIAIFCDTPSFPCAYKTDQPRLTAGALMMAGGAIIGAAGIPMWLVGSRFVVVHSGEKKASAMAEVRVGVGSASVRMRF